jgi:hypothetical protein
LIWRSYTSVHVHCTPTCTFIHCTPICMYTVHVLHVAKDSYVLPLGKSITCEINPA